MKRALEFDSWLTRLGIAEEDGYITDLYFAPGGRPVGLFWQETPLLWRARAEVEEYLRGERKDFDLPLRPRGTPFQEEVWRALAAIPYGETRTYGEIARQVGRPKACRAVGGANHRNPIAILLPCHRVIGADGTLTGYGGGLDIKRALLSLEAASVSQRETVEGGERESGSAPSCKLVLGGFAAGRNHAFG